MHIPQDRQVSASNKSLSSLMKNYNGAEQSLLVQQKGRMCVMCSSSEEHWKDSVRAGAGKFLRPPACAASAHPGPLVPCWAAAA